MSPKARHYTIILLVFCVTGSLAATLSRLILNGLFGMEGTLWSGSWGYRAAYIALIPPSYSTMLYLIGSLVGKREFFRKRVMRVWGRPLRLLGLTASLIRR